MKLNYRILINTAELIEFSWQAECDEYTAKNLTKKDFQKLNKIFDSISKIYMNLPDWTDGIYSKEEYEKLYDKFWKVFKHYKKDICRYAPLIKRLTEEVNYCDCWGNARN